MRFVKGWWYSRTPKMRAEDLAGIGAVLISGFVVVVLVVSSAIFMAAAAAAVLDIGPPMCHYDGTCPR